MRISSLIEKQEPAVITEAARFGNRERNAILKQINKFRFGVEYEFNVDEGVPFLDKLIKIDKPLESPMIRDASPHLVKIAKAFEKFQDLGSVGTLDGFISDMQDYVTGQATEIEIDYFEDTVVPEASLFCKVFMNSVVVPSQEVRRKYKGTALDEMGLLNQSTVRQSDVSAIAEIASIGGSRINNPLALKIRTASSAIKRYLEVDCDMVPVTITPQKHHSGMLSMMHAEIVERNTSTPSKVDVVRSSLGIPSNYIEQIIPDVTVPEGVEVVTKPLSYNDTMDIMERVFQFIQNNGNTDSSTGLHVNISTSPDIDLSSINFVKMMVLLDIDFFQGLSRGSQKFLKYPVRSDWVTPIYQFLAADSGAKLLRLAEIYAFNKPDTFVRYFEESVRKDNEKKRAINLMHLLNVDASQRRVEFRFLGGVNYERRYEEIQNDILQFCYMMSAGASESFLQREYLEGIIRIMDRVTRSTPINGEKFSSFSSLINFVRKRG